MTIHTSSKAFKIELPEARAFDMRGTLWRVLATGDDTGGVVGALDERCVRGVAAPLHIHEREDEVFYVLDGEITFLAGETAIRARAGTFVYLPRLIAHGFRVETDEARVFNFVTPAGFERLVLDAGMAARYDDLPRPPQVDHGARAPNLLDTIRIKYGMRVDVIGRGFDDDR